jgi:hypothetical protein
MVGNNSRLFERGIPEISRWGWRRPENILLAVAEGLGHLDQKLSANRFTMAFGQVERFRTLIKLPQLLQRVRQIAVQLCMKFPIIEPDVPSA